MMEKKIKWFPKKYLTKVAIKGITEFCEKEPRFGERYKFVQRIENHLQLIGLIDELEKTWKRSPFKKRSKFTFKFSTDQFSLWINSAYVKEYDGTDNYRVSAGYDQTDKFVFKVHVKHVPGKKNKRVAQAVISY